MRRARVALIAITVMGSLLATAPGGARDLAPQAARGLTLPAGFVARVFAQPPIVPTTLTWGPDTTEALGAAGSSLHGAFLYVGGVAGNPLSCDGCGRVVAISDEGTMTFAAEGLNSVLGIAFSSDHTMWVTDNLNSRGRVLALSDTDGDGVFETSRVVLKNIPNGRHQTNGLTFGPDGMLYVANGNATDNGLECGPPLGPRDQVGFPEPLKSFYEETFRNTECADPEIDPWTGSILRINPAWNDVDLMADVRVDEDPFYAEDGMDDETVLVAEGFRNIYDVDFNPRRPNELWTPMNGPDNPSGSEPIYGLEVDDEQVVGFTDPPEGEEPQPIFGPVIEDAGFPSCLYDPHLNPFPDPTTGHSHVGDPEPDDTPHDGVKAAYGLCDKENVLRPRDVLDEGHEGTSGLAFERGGHFPERYRGDLFLAEWGSLWNLNGIPIDPPGHGNPSGHKLMHLEINEDGSVGRVREFMTGALPIDVTFSEAGLMYLADMSGQIYEISHVTDTSPTAPVTMTSGQFVPQVLPVIRGQTVVWENDDTVPHRVTFQRGVRAVATNENFELSCTEMRDMNSAEIQPGQTHSFTFDTAGVYHYNDSAQCTDATTPMNGTIVVTTVER